MLQNAYFLAKIGADTAENEHHFAEILTKNGDAVRDAVRRAAGHLDEAHAKGLTLEERGGRQVQLSQRLTHMVDRALSDRLPPPGAAASTAAPPSGRRHDGRSAKFRQNVARFRLYRHQSLQVNTRSSAFFKIYQII